jgi:uncharacterized membrane protein YciS (DUF1049 family)
VKTPALPSVRQENKKLWYGNTVLSDARYTCFSAPLAGLFNAGLLAGFLIMQFFTFDF